MTRCSGCEQRESELECLRNQVAQLEEQLSWFRTHQTLARGVAGEKLMANAAIASLTKHTDSVDLILSDGRTVEVKATGITRQHGDGSTSGRWQWEKVFGQTNAKDYDYLVLVAEADPRFAHAYLEPESTQVLFLVPRDDVWALTVNGAGGARRIAVTTNPNRARGSAAALFTDFQVRAAEVEALLHSTVDLQPTHRQTPAGAPPVGM